MLKLRPIEAGTVAGICIAGFLFLSWGFVEDVFAWASGEYAGVSAPWVAVAWPFSVLGLLYAWITLRTLLRGADALTDRADAVLFLHPRVFSVAKTDVQDVAVVDSRALFTTVKTLEVVTRSGEKKFVPLKAMRGAPDDIRDAFLRMIHRKET